MATKKTDTQRVKIALPGCPPEAKVFLACGIVRNKGVYDLPTEDAAALIDTDRAMLAGKVEDADVSAIEPRTIGLGLDAPEAAKEG